MPTHAAPLRGGFCSPNDVYLRRPHCNMGKCFTACGKVKPQVRKCTPQVQVRHSNKDGAGGVLGAAHCGRRLRSLPGEPTVQSSASVINTQIENTRVLPTPGSRRRSREARAASGLASGPKPGPRRVSISALSTGLVSASLCVLDLYSSYHCKMGKGHTSPPGLL